jgi:protein TonB
MSATINSFPAFHSMNSPRGWILAAIVLIHFGFFVLLSSSMGVNLLYEPRPPAVLVTPAPIEKIKPPEPQPTAPVEMRQQAVYVPPPQLPPMSTEAQPDTAPAQVTHTPAPPVSYQTAGSAEPVITAPQIDPRRGLSEPTYPAEAIRAGHTGTVVLSIYVLEDGRIGDVRLDASSGYPKLDESAMREARRWRLKPGMRDGVPVAMWKQIPITFQLQGSGSRRF